MHFGHEWQEARQRRKDQHEDRIGQLDPFSDADNQNGGEK